MIFKCLPESQLLLTHKTAPLADVYRAGKCPDCGEFAVGTWRTPNAPVFCRHGHMWNRHEASLYAEGVRGR